MVKNLLFFLVLKIFKEQLYSKKWCFCLFLIPLYSRELVRNSRSIFQEQDCTLFQLFLVGKEERQNSNYGIEFSQKYQKNGCTLVKNRQGNVQWIVFCEKVGVPKFFLGVLFFTKMSQEKASRKKCSQPIIVCEKCEAPKTFKNY